MQARAHRRHDRCVDRYSDNGKSAADYSQVMTSHAVGHHAFHIAASLPPKRPYARFPYVWRRPAVRGILIGIPGMIEIRPAYLLSMFWQRVSETFRKIASVSCGMTFLPSDSWLSMLRSGGVYLPSFSGGGVGSRSGNGGSTGMCSSGGMGGMGGFLGGITGGCMGCGGSLIGGLIGVSCMAAAPRSCV